MSPDWRSDPRWLLYGYDPAHWTSEPLKPTKDAERSADGYWASVTVTDEQTGERREVATWLIVGPSPAEKKALDRQARRRLGDSRTLL